MRAARARRPLAVPSLLFAFAVAVVGGTPLFAAELGVEPGESVFAVLTHKAGLAAGLAHDHLIVAPEPKVSILFQEAQPEATRVLFSTSVESLEVDSPEARAKWSPRLRERGRLKDSLPPVPESDRRKVRAAMLGESQLDGTHYPEIRAEVLRLERTPDPLPPGRTPFELVLRVTIHGRTVERREAVEWSYAEGVLRAEVLAELHFREFGIEPYSTMLGAIRNDDRFDLFVRVVARETETPPEASSAGAPQRRSR